MNLRLLRLRGPDFMGSLVASLCRDDIGRVVPQSILVPSLWDSSHSFGMTVRSGCPCPPSVIPTENPEDSTRNLMNPGFFLCFSGPAFMGSLVGLSASLDGSFRIQASPSGLPSSRKASIKEFNQLTILASLRVLRTGPLRAGRA